MRCTFPDCPRLPAVRNRAGQDVCRLHQPVVIGTCDDLGHGRHSEGVSDQ